jgi:hypothetical protein
MGRVCAVTLHHIYIHLSLLIRQSSPHQLSLPWSPYHRRSPLSNHIWDSCHTSSSITSDLGSACSDLHPYWRFYWVEGHFTMNEMQQGLCYDERWSASVFQMNDAQWHSLSTLYPITLPDVLPSYSTDRCNSHHVILPCALFCYSPPLVFACISACKFEYFCTVSCKVRWVWDDNFGVELG